MLRQLQSVRYCVSPWLYSDLFLLTFENGREVIARVNMADGGGRELPEELRRIRVQSEVSFPIMQIIPRFIPAYGISRLQGLSGSKSTLLFLCQRSMHMMIVQITRLGVPTSCKRGYVTGSNCFQKLTWNYLSFWVKDLTTSGTDIWRRIKEWSSWSKSPALKGSFSRRASPLLEAFMMIPRPAFELGV